MGEKRGLTKKPKADHLSPNVTTPKHPSKNDRSRSPMTPELADKDLPYNLVGPKIFGLEDDFADEVKNNTGRPLEPGNVVKAKSNKYTVVSVLGTRTYVVTSSESREPLVMKTEAALLPPDGPILRRELLFLINAHKRLRAVHRTHFMRFVDRTGGLSDPSFSAVFMNKAKFSLEDVRRTQLDGAEFSPQTALRLCMETLQAIHDVHVNVYVHRDIQPKNFLIGNVRNGKSVIFITGLSYAYDLMHRDEKVGLPSIKKLAKLPAMSAVFQTRSYHRYFDVKDPIADLESWIYMCYDLFNSKALPWAQPAKLREREYVSHKEAFFSGAYDAKFEQLGVPSSLNSIRSYFTRIVHDDLIDYPFFAHILMLIAAELGVDWHAPYEWQKSAKTSKRSKAETEENNTLDDTPEAGQVQYESVDEIELPKMKGQKERMSVEGTQDIDSPVGENVVIRPMARKSQRNATEDNDESDGNAAKFSRAPGKTNQDKKDSQRKPDKKAAKSLYIPLAKERNLDNP